MDLYMQSVIKDIAMCRVDKEKVTDLVKVLYFMGRAEKSSNVKEEEQEGDDKNIRRMANMLSESLKKIESLDELTPVEF